MDFGFCQTKDSERQFGIVPFSRLTSTMANLVVVPDSIDGGCTAKKFIDRVFRQHELSFFLPRTENFFSRVHLKRRLFGCMALDWTYPQRITR